MYISKDVEAILDWGTKILLVQFNVSKTQTYIFFSSIITESPIHMVISGFMLANRESFNLEGVTFEHNPSWHNYVPTLAH